MIEDVMNREDEEKEIELLESEMNDNSDLNEEKGDCGD